MRIAFLGTPEFCLPSLQMLYAAGHTLTVFTQPDRPVGRHGTLTAPPAKLFAQAHGIPVLQFERIRQPEGVAALKDFAPELMVTAAFGQLLSAENLAIPKYGCINVHGSLLPKYRGAAPIQWAVIDGEAQTGVTTMLTDIGMDTGDILLCERTGIGPDETAGELYTRLAVLGAETLRRTLDALEAGKLVRIPQDERLASKCPMLKKEHGRLDFTQSAQRVHNRVRGVNPWPGAYAMLDTTVIKIWRTRVLSQDDAPATKPASDAPGIVLGDAKRGMFVQCADAPLEILELQAPGGKRMDGKTFLRGRPLAGMTLQ